MVPENRRKNVGQGAKIVAFAELSARQEPAGAPVIDLGLGWSSHPRGRERFVPRSRYRDGPRPGAPDSGHGGRTVTPPPHHRVVVVGALLLDSTYELERLEAFDETEGRPGS